MTGAAGFEIPEKTIRWAKVAASEFDRASAAFFQRLGKRDLIHIFVETDSNTGEKVKKVKITGKLDEDIERKATDALLHARHSFDQSLNAACSLLWGKRSKLHYPWSNDLDDLNGRLKNPGIDPRLRDTIRAHQPYRTSDGHPTGNDLVRVIAMIANRKHDLGLAIAAELNGVRYGHIHIKEAMSFSVPAPRWNPDKNEAELMRWIGDVEVSPDCQFAFYIRVVDTRFSEPVNALVALQAFIAKAEEVCETLKAKCLEITG